MYVLWLINYNVLIFLDGLSVAGEGALSSINTLKKLCDG